MEADFKKITSVEELLQERATEDNDLIEKITLFFEDVGGKILLDLIEGKINQAGTLVLDGGLDLGVGKDGAYCALETYKQIGVVSGLKSLYDDLIFIKNYKGVDDENIESMG